MTNIRTANRPSQLDDWIGAGAIEPDDDRLDEIGAGPGPTRPGPPS